jgi:non-specific serine/threonine protein kinase
VRQVTITRLLMRHSIEEKMMELKKRKLKLYRALLEDAEQDAGGSIGREDFEFLLGT